MGDVETEGVIQLPDGLQAHLANYCGHPNGVGNLWVTDSEGSEVWRSKTQGHPDELFVGVRLSGGVLRANSYGGYLFEIDPRTGAILSTRFTK